MTAEKRRLPMNAYCDNAFSTEGFFNWKKDWNVLKYTSAPLLIVCSNIWLQDWLMRVLWLQKNRNGH